MSKTINLGPVSAYALAKKHGFVGTEAEWLKSLGAHIGENGNWWVGEEDLGVLADPAELSKLTQQAQAAQTAAEDAAGAAAENAEAAQRSASNAGNAAGAAVTSASAAKTAQEAAAKSASAATDSAAAAQTSAEEASKSAAEATGSATAAQSAQTAAEAAQSAADADAAATAEALKVVEGAAEAEQGRVAAEAARVAADAERAEAITTIADGLSALRARENVLTGSASGTVVSVEDAAVAPLCGLHIYGKSTQDGTPSPDNPVPIESVGDSGTMAVKVTGKNLLNISKNTTLDAYGLTWTFADGLLSISGTVPENMTYPRISLSALNSNLTLPAGRYKLIVFNHGKVNSDFLPKLLSPKYSNPSGNDTYLSTSKILTLDSNYTFNGLVLSAPLSGKAVDAAYEIMVVNVDAAGAAPTSYEPYHEQLLTLSTPGGLPGIPVDANGTYTDADGQQWVCDEIDLVRGVYVQRVKATELSPDIAWLHRKTNSRNNNNFQLRIYNADVSAQMKPCFCNILRYTNSVWDDIPQNLPKIYANDQEITISFPPNSEYSSLEAFKQLLTNVKSVIYYILATPIERPLTDDEITAYKALTTYAPNTVVQADGAHIALDYQRDVNIVIKNLEDAIASITTQ